jgi:hypothetical protein
VVHFTGLYRENRGHRDYFVDIFGLFSQLREWLDHNLRLIRFLRLLCGFSPAFYRFDLREFLAKLVSQGAFELF